MESDTRTVEAGATEARTLAEPITIRRLGNGWNLREGNSGIPEILSPEELVEQVAIRVGARTEAARPDAGTLEARALIDAVFAVIPPLAKDRTPEQTHAFLTAVKAADALAASRTEAPAAEPVYTFRREGTGAAPAAGTPLAEALDVCDQIRRILRAHDDLPLRDLPGCVEALEIANRANFADAERALTSEAEPREPDGYADPDNVVRFNYGEVNLVAYKCLPSHRGAHIPVWIGQPPREPRPPLEREPKRKKCGRCDGTGVMDTIPHQTGDGDVELEPIRCEDCDGFGDAPEPRAGEPQDARRTIKDPPRGPDSFTREEAAAAVRAVAQDARAGALGELAEHWSARLSGDAITMYNGSTHWEGCEREHWRCAMARFTAALAAPRAEPSPAEREAEIIDYVCQHATAQISVTVGSNWTRAHEDLIRLAIKRHTRDALRLSASPPASSGGSATP